MNRIVGPLLIVTALALPAHAQAPRAVDRPTTDWKTVRSAHFIAFGDAREEDLAATLREVETFRASLAAFGLTTASTNDPVKVVVFRNDSVLAPFRPRDETGRVRESAVGYFLTRPDVTYLVLSGRPAGDRSLVFRIALHEYAHDVLVNNIPQIPLWLNEGLAEFYASVASDDRPGISTIGAPLVDRVRALSPRRLLPLDELTTQVGAVDFVNSVADHSVFYAQSWALVHYLLIGSGSARSGQLDQYIQAIGLGASADGAFREVFGPIDELQRELAQYIERRQFNTKTLSTATPQSDAPLAPPTALLESEVAALKGDLLVRVRALGAAERELDRALALSPTNATARLALALLRIEESRFDDAVQLLQALVTERPDWRVGHTYLSSALRRAGRFEEAFQEFEKAEALK